MKDEWEGEKKRTPEKDKARRGGEDDMKEKNR